METFIRKHRDGERTHTIYTQEEAKEAGLTVVGDWREARPGDWVLTSDGYVAQCIGRSGYATKRGTRTFLRFSFCIAVLEFTKEIRWEERRGTRNFGIHNLNWFEMEVRTERFKRLVTAYAHMMMRGKINYDELGNIYRADQKNPAATVRVLLKKQETKKMITEELKTILDGAGITEYKLAEIWSAGLERAMKQNDVKAILAYFTEMADIRGWKDKKKVVERGQIDFGEITGALEAHEQEKKAISAKYEKETEE